MLSRRCSAPSDASSEFYNFRSIKGIKFGLDDRICCGDAGAWGDYVVRLEGHATGLDDKAAHFSVHGVLPGGEVGAADGFFVMNEESSVVVRERGGGWRDGVIEVTL